jgi:phosphatidylinositol phospholipase C epsilon
LAVLDEVEEGHIDLRIVKEVQIGSSTADLNFLSKKFSLGEMTPENNSISLLYGSNIAENKLLEFIMPTSVAEIFQRGLKRLVDTSLNQQMYTIDRRIQWLKEKYLQMFYDGGKCQGPSPADAIKV